MRRIFLNARAREKSVAFASAEPREQAAPPEQRATTLRDVSAARDRGVSRRPTIRTCEGTHGRIAPVAWLWVMININVSLSRFAQRAMRR
jgi:hypothetical protein